MRGATFIYTLILGTIALGILVGFLKIEILEIIYKYLFMCIMSFFMLSLIYFPLKNWLIGIRGVRSYIIEKGKHFTSFLPIFKPYWGEKNINFSVKISLVGYDGSFNEEQISKIFGYNYGFPKIDFKNFRLVHQNSYRIGYRLKGNTLEFVEYERRAGEILPSNILKVVELEEKHGIKLTPYLDFSFSTKKWGYFLNRPYFGGKIPAPCRLFFKYKII